MCNVHCTYMFCTECSGRGHWCSVVHLFCRLHNPTLSKIEVTTTRPVQWGDLGTLLEIQCYDFAVCWLEWPDTNVCKKLICDAIWHPWTKHWRNLKSVQRQTLLLLSISLCQGITLTLYTFNRLLIVDYCWCHQNRCFEMQSACIDIIYSIVSWCEFSLENSSKLCYLAHIMRGTYKIYRGV